MRTKEGLVYGVNVAAIQQKLSSNPAVYKVLSSVLLKNEQKIIDIIKMVLIDIKDNGFKADELKIALKEMQESWRNFNDANDGTAHSIAKNVINSEHDEGYINAEQNLTKLDIETVNRVFNDFIANSVKAKLIFSNQ